MVTVRKTDSLGARPDREESVNNFVEFVAYLGPKGLAQGVGRHSTHNEMDLRQSGRNATSGYASPWAVV
jgi:hypothetical protein